MLKLEVIGNVGRVKLVTPKGKSPVLNVSLATNRKVGDREYTDWTSIKIWGDRAQKLAPYIGKGTKLFIAGRPEARAYKANDGTAKAEMIVHANDVEFLSSKRDADGTPDYDHNEEEAELPFESAA